jgi:hypothetical protein
MALRLPLLVRSALAAERLLCTLQRLHSLFWGEALWGWYSPKQRETINHTLAQIVWGATAGYLPGGSFFEGGLFDWEWRAISEPPFPRSGRILLGGAGGGRELIQLCRSGFDVVAFEPSERLCEGARQAVSPFPGSIVVQASYHDLVTAARERTGPLAAHVLNASFDAVFFGWSSFNFAFTDMDCRELLNATRMVAPIAPLLLSFGSILGAEDGRLDRLRPVIRRVCKLLGAPADRSRGDEFSLGGFAHFFSLDEFGFAASDSGYRIHHIRPVLESYYYAILTPQ